MIHCCCSSPRMVSVVADSLRVCGDRKKSFPPPVAKSQNFGIMAGSVYAWDGVTVPGGHRHEIVVKPCRALSRCSLVNGPAVRPGRIADQRQWPASRHHGRSAEAGGKAPYIAGGSA